MVHYLFDLQVNKKSLETFAAGKKKVKKIPCMRRISIAIFDSEMQWPIYKEQKLLTTKGGLWLKVSKEMGTSVL